MKKKNQFLLCAVLILFSCCPLLLIGQGLVVEQGTTLSNGGNGYGVFGSQSGNHIVLSNSEIQQRIGAENSILFLNYRGGDLSLAHGNGTSSNVFIGGGADNNGLLNGYNTLYVRGDNDRVGIGTSIPSSKLEVMDGNITVDNGNIKINAPAPNLALFAADGSTPLANIGSILGGLVMQNQSTGATADILMTTENGTLKLENDGKLGIGETSPNADIHLQQSTNNENTAAGLFFEDAEAEFAGEGWQIAHSGLHFSFVDKVEGDNERRAYIENNTGNYVQPPAPPLAPNRNNNSLKNTLSKIKQLQATFYQKKTKRSETSMLGFSAETVKNSFPELIHYDENGEMGLAYGEFGVLAIQAIQEQQILIEKAAAEKEALQDRITELEAQVAEFSTLNDRLLALETNLQSCCLQHQSPAQQPHDIHSDDVEFAQDRAQLQQNFPNPFHQQSDIQYYLPNDVQSAHLLISDLNGQVIKTYEVQGQGIGKVVVDGTAFGAGLYIYTLIVNEKVVDTKQMVLTK